jgi:hypothetical protein
MLSKSLWARRPVATALQTRSPFPGHATPARPLPYFTIDFWDSENAYQQFLEANRASYVEPHCSTEALTLKERPVVSSDMPFTTDSSISAPS